VAHAECVRIGKRQAELALDLPMVLDDAVELAADVLCRRLHAREQAGNRLLELRVDHVILPVSIHVGIRPQILERLLTLFLVVHQVDALDAVALLHAPLSASK